MNLLQKMDKNSPALAPLPVTDAVDRYISPPAAMLFVSAL
jgi:hypothetical protein